MSKRATLHATSWLFSERLIRMFVGFFIHAWIARYFSPADFGAISTVIKTVSVYYVFGMMGVDEIIIRELLRRPGDEKKVLSTVLGVRLLVGIVGWLVMMGLALVFNDSEGKLLLAIALFGLTIPLQALITFELPFMARMQLRPVFFARNGSYGISSTIKMGAMLAHVTQLGFIAIYALEELMWKGIMWLQAWRHGLVGLGWDSSWARRVLESGVLHFMAGFVVLFDQRLPFLIMGRFASPESVGNYAVAVALVDMAILLPISIAAGMFPPIAQAHLIPGSNYPRLRQNMLDALVWLGITFFIGTYFCAPWIVEIIYQGKYADAVPVLRGLAGLVVWHFFNLGRFKILAIEEGLREWLGLNCLSVCLNGLLLWRLFPVYGIMSVVYAGLSSQVLANVFFAIFSKKTRANLWWFVVTLVAPLRWARLIKF